MSSFLSRRSNESNEVFPTKVRSPSGEPAIDELEGMWTSYILFPEGGNPGTSACDAAGGCRETSSFERGPFAEMNGNAMCADSHHTDDLRPSVDNILGDESTGEGIDWLAGQRRKGASDAARTG